MSALRLLFLCCIVAVILLRPVANAQDHDAAQYAAMSERLTKALADQGAAPLGHRAPFAESMLADAVWFQHPGCAEEAVAMPFHIILDMEGTRAMNDVLEWPYRVFYLDTSGPEIAKHTLLRRALTAKLQNVILGERHAALRGAVVIAAPASCPQALGTDLSRVWSAAL